MRILILNWRDIKHPLAGGAEVSTHQHAKKWHQAGNSIIQFSSSFEGSKKEEIIDGIKIIRRGNHYTVHLHAFWYYITKLRREVDLIVDEFHFIPFFTPLYSKKRKIAFIHETAEEVWFKNQYFPINIAGYLLEPLFFKLYRKIPFLTVSQSTKKDLIRFGINQDRIIVIHNGSSPISSSLKKNNNPIIVYLGRLAADKGTKDVILAFPTIKNAFPESRLWVVGKEEKKGTKESLMQLAEKLKQQESIKFFGYVAEKEKYDLLKQAWILIHPSVKEGWGLTVIEAASQGTPSIAYDSAGLRDSIKDGITGFLIKEKTPEALAEKVIAALNNKEQLNKISKEALSWSKQFSWEKSTSESLKLIQRTK